MGYAYFQKKLIKKYDLNKTDKFGKIILNNCQLLKLLNESKFVNEACTLK